MTLRWVIAGGGTGGHVTPALALGEAIRERGDEVLFMGSDRGLEARLLPQAGFDWVALGSRQVMGRGVLGRTAGVCSILAATLRAHRELRRFAADRLISVGGYASMPAVLASVFSRVPLALLEPNAVPGRSSRIAARLAKRVFVGFRVTADRLGVRPDRVRCFGVPLRQSLVAAFGGAEPRREPAPPFHLLVFGGSQGARQINEAVMDALPRLADAPIEVFHQAGDADRERVAAAYAKSGVTAEVVAFEPNMPARYRWADLALCRAGGLTVAELALAGLPALLVPYPHAADDHQAANAHELEVAGAARMLNSRSFNADALAAALLPLLETPEELARMGAAAGRLSRPEAARHIVDECAGMREV
ncbi:MAG: undecaprenyldiphospho-muramoylpentapeptide beta-N-acetylglucosaminyltransferase [Proteobacteria bacterium]|nr:undecaprenyldiphospho-muramoylpentapeptide beta-N-acetylglucosaminyltransferase [Pseudomonadota bacterium]